MIESSIRSNEYMTLYFLEEMRESRDRNGKKKGRRELSESDPQIWDGVNHYQMILKRLIIVTITGYTHSKQQEEVGGRKWKDIRLKKFVTLVLIISEREYDRDKSFISSLPSDHFRRKKEGMGGVVTSVVY